MLVVASSPWTTNKRCLSVEEILPLPIDLHRIALSEHNAEGILRRKHLCRRQKKRKKNDVAEVTTSSSFSCLQP